MTMGEKPTNSQPMMEKQPFAVPQDQQLHQQQQEQQQVSGYSGPGVVQESTWSNSMWDCFSPGSLCLKAAFCPCFVYGKTQHRLSRDPNLMGYERFNADVGRYVTSGSEDSRWSYFTTGISETVSNGSGIK